MIKGKVRKEDEVGRSIRTVFEDQVKSRGMEVRVLPQGFTAMTKREYRVK